MGAMGPHGVLSALLASLLAFSNHSQMMPAPGDNPSGPPNATEILLDEGVSADAAHPPRKPVVEYLDYLWSKPAALGNPTPGYDGRTSYFSWLLPP
eukprot:533973-Heterocapsa_arctica.AAC.1